MASYNFVTFSANSSYRSIVEKVFSVPLQQIYYQSSEYLNRVYTGEYRSEILIDQDKPVGILIYRPPTSSSSTFKLKALTTPMTEETRGKGYSQVLLDRVMKVAQTHLVSSIFTEINASEAKVFAPFFEAAGFKRQILKDHETFTFHLPSVSTNRKRAREEGGREEGGRQEERVREEGASFVFPQEKRMRMTNTINHSCPLKQQYLAQIASGQKTVEGRINTGVFKKFNAGDTVSFYSGSSKVSCQITKIETFNSFKAMLETCGVQKCLADVRSLETAVQIYDNIPGYREKASKFGVLAIHIALLKETT